ncbi:MAG: HAMP domain-containing histidine kinase [Chloroflexi bacterium]|nr:HAMP domain-containing histidine kinase [Chloroflexota bacterium]
MPSSLRARLLLSYVVVVLTAVAAAALALTVLLRGYQVQLAQERLGDLTIPVALQIREVARQGGGPDQVTGFLREQADELGVRILLVNTRGRIVADSGSPDLRGQIFQMPGQPPAGRLRSLTGRFQPPGGDRYVVAAVSTAGLGGPPRSEVAMLVLALPESAVPSPWRVLGPRLLVAAAASLTAAGLLALALIRWMDRPLQRLLAATNDIAAGQYQARVPVEGPREIARLAEGFNRMAAEVARSQGTLRAFLADVSHELRTPLTAVRGFTQALLDGTIADDTDRRRALEVVDQETKRLQGLVAELFELSRLQARQTRLDRRPVEIGDVLHLCAEVFGPRADGQLIGLHVEAPGGLVVLADFDRLEQVFSNLLDNALRHTPAGGRVDLRARAAGGAVEALVEDTGPGILPEDLPRVFERYRRGAGGGLGLGLAIAREIVEAHGGTIRVESLPEGGARFLVVLPKATQ